MKSNLYHWKNFYRSIAVTLFFLLVFQPFAFAQNTKNNTPSQPVSEENPAKVSGQQLFCNRDFSNFLANGLEIRLLDKDYWLDILTIPGYSTSRYSANICRYNDIASILNRINSARQRLRQAFYVCDITTTDVVTQQYYQLEAELYYLRHYADNQLVEDRNFQKKFMDLFINQEKYFSQEKGVQLYQSFKAKYDAKRKTYEQCEDPGLATLKNKLNELASLLDTLDKIGQQFSRNLDQKTKKSEERIEKNSMFSAKSFGDFINRAVDFRVNGDDITDPTYWEQLTSGDTGALNALNVNLPFTGNYSQSQALSDINFAQTRNDTRDLEIDYTTEYEAKYLINDDQFTAEAVTNLNTLLGIVESTYPELTKVASCTKMIVDKQCS